MNVEEYFIKYPEDICKSYSLPEADKSIHLSTIFWNIEYAKYTPDIRELQEKKQDMIDAFNLKS